jgi:uncharacterized membrane protein (UPF0127 family)
MLLRDPVALVCALTVSACIAAIVLISPRRSQRCSKVLRACLVSPDGAVVPVVVECAIGVREQRVGLMFRKAVPDGTGMLFRWPRPKRSAIWMRNTLVPLDLVFLSARGAVMSITTRAPRGWAFSGLWFRSCGVVELPGGFCGRNGIAPGWTFRISGSGRASDLRVSRQDRAA